VIPPSTPAAVLESVRLLAALGRTAPAELTDRAADYVRTTHATIPARRGGSPAPR
jgi:hypothetical protein